MSYDIRVVNKKTEEPVFLNEKRYDCDGNICLNSLNEAHTNITYNYAPWFYEIWPKHDNTKIVNPSDEMFGNDHDGGIRSLYGKPLNEVISELDIAIEKLKGEKPDEDYWKGTKGNARLALFKLKQLCETAKFVNDDVELTIVGD